MCERSRLQLHVNECMSCVNECGVSTIEKRPPYTFCQSQCIAPMQWLRGKRSKPGAAGDLTTSSSPLAAPPTLQRRVSWAATEAEAPPAGTFAPRNNKHIPDGVPSSPSILRVRDCAHTWRLALPAARRRPRPAAPAVGGRTGKSSRRAFALLLADVCRFKRTFGRTFVTVFLFALGT